MINSSRSGYDIKSARRSLNILFSEWGNRGVHLWKVALQTDTLVQGQADYTTPSDCSDVLEAYYRNNSTPAAPRSIKHLVRLIVLLMQQFLTNYHKVFLLSIMLIDKIILLFIYIKHRILYIPVLVINWNIIILKRFKMLVLILIPLMFIILFYLVWYLV